MTQPRIKDNVVYHTDGMVRGAIDPFWAHQSQVWCLYPDQVVEGQYALLLSTLAMSFIENTALPYLGQDLFHDVPQPTDSHVAR
jgi:hypothetical protein